MPTTTPRTRTSPFTRFRSGTREPEKARQNPLFRWIALAVTTGLIVYFFPRSNETPQSYEIGSIWSGDTVRAAFDFPIYKEPETIEKDREAASDTTLPVFVPTTTTLLTLRDTLDALVAQIDTARSDLVLSDGAQTWLGSLPPEQRAAAAGEIADALHLSLRTPFSAGVIDRQKSSIEVPRFVVRRGDAIEEEMMLGNVYDSAGTIYAVESDFSRRAMTPQQYAFAMDLFRRIYRPSLRYSESLTREAEQSAIANVPTTYGIVSEGEVIVTPGEPVTDRVAQMLVSYDRSRHQRQEESSPWLKLLGNFGHVAILIGLPLLYLFNFRRRIYSDNLQLSIILGGLLLISFLAWLSVKIPSSLPIEYLILAPFYSMLLAILFDSRTAFYLTVSACLIVAGIRGADYTIAIAILSSGVMAAYTVRDIKSRTQLFRSIAFSIVGYAVAILALGLEQEMSWETIGLRLGFAGISAIISPVLTFAAILMLESVFTVATDLKLLEYDDLNHPLLRMLADKAPGTYQHTLTIARLAERAASAVGANALQAKVGALYHDIGKIAKPEYFVENQMQMGNKHDRMKPEQSARIIREHVLDGMRIARQYGLPERIVDFIPTHHGTTAIQYFLDKAREENPDVDAEQFRYPGPPPHSRETAIVMLADAVEATTRSLANPTREEIEVTVDRSIKKRFSEGQLDRCDLTLADLTKIKEAFIKNLVGISHPRIRYKSDEERAKLEAEAKEMGKRKSAEATKEVPYIDDAFGGLGAGKKE